MTQGTFFQETQPNSPGEKVATQLCFNTVLYVCRASTPETDQILKEDESIQSLEDIEQYEERVHVRRKLSKVDSFKSLLFNKDEAKRSKSKDGSARNEKREVQEKGSMINLRLPQPSDYEVSCLDRHDRWHLLQHKNLHHEQSDLDESSTVANVNQATGKHARDLQHNNEMSSASHNKKYKPYVQQHPSNSLVNLNTSQRLNSLPRNTKISRSEESGYDSDMTRSVAAKSPKISDKSEESDSSGLSGYTSDTDTQSYYKEPRRAKDTHSQQRSKSITPDKPPRKSLELLSDTSKSKPITRSNSQPSVSGRMSLSTKYKEKQEASSNISFKVGEYHSNREERNHLSLYRCLVLSRIAHLSWVSSLVARVT